MSSSPAGPLAGAGLRQKSDPSALPRRRTLRLAGFDYAHPGAYFVTICTQGREPLLGQIGADGVGLTGAGRMVGAIWEQLPRHVPNLRSDAFVVMPDHVHGIVFLEDDGPERANLADVVRRLKSSTTVAYCRGVALEGWPPFSGRLWQRNYFERIIRDDDELVRLREYIRTNPARAATRR